MNITHDNQGYTSVKSIKSVYPKLHERIVELSNAIDLLSYDNLYHLFVFEETPEGPDFWCSVNRYEGMEDAKKMQPHLFEQTTSSVDFSGNKMKHQTILALISYVHLLMIEEGLDAIHNLDVIPNGQVKMHFPNLTRYDLPQGITYDQPTGWFRKIPK